MQARLDTIQPPKHSCRALVGSGGDLVVSSKDSGALLDPDSSADGAIVIWEIVPHTAVATHKHFESNIGVVVGA
jgi:hypothetical protein